MKKLIVFIVANLFFRFALMASSWPVPTTLNTANSTPTSTKSVGQPDNVWLVSDNGINGSYVPAVVCGIAPGCCWAASTSNSADWITFPHKTTYGPTHSCLTYSSEAEHFCLGAVDEFYKLVFNLPTNACGIPYTSYCLKMKFNADNCVYKIYLNGNNVYTTTSSNPNTATDYTSSTGTTQTWCSGFQVGANTIIVEVKSGGPTGPDYTGLLAEVDVSGTTQPCGDGGCCLGNACGAAQNPLAGDYEIPLNSNEFYYSGDVAHRDKVNVGLNCSTLFPGKFNVTTAFPSDPAPASNGDSYSIYSTNTNLTDHSMNTGVYGSASCNSGEGSGNNQRGVWGLANGGIDARGVFGQGKGAYKSYGGYFESNTSNRIGINYGLYTEAFNGQLNYGIYSTVGGTPFNGTGPNWAGWFDGDVLTTTGYTPSDRSLKKDIKTINNSLDIISKLNPVTYNFDLEANKGINLSAAKQYGFISQEVKLILPELTRVAIQPAKKDAAGREISPQREILALNYNGFIAILAKGIQEQQQTISDLENRVSSLEKEMAEISAKTGKTTTGINNNAGMSGFSMEQNDPNPFTGETVIRYTLPAQTNTASLVVYDLTGKQIASLPIAEKGSSSVTITSEKLAAGMYIYSIVADGRILDSKRMVVAGK